MILMLMQTLNLNAWTRPLIAIASREPRAVCLRLCMTMDYGHHAQGPLRRAMPPRLELIGNDFILIGNDTRS